MRIATAQLNYRIGDFNYNFQLHKSHCEKAIAEKADLIIFSELSVCGYPPRDFLEFNDFIQRCREVIAKLLPISNDIAIILGSPAINPVADGKDLYNAAFFLWQGKIHGQANKALLPTYDIFDEYRYFEPAKEFKVIDFKGKKIALNVCEDIWDVDNENPLYAMCPMDELIKQGPDFMINISASPFTYSHAQERLDIVKANCKRYNIPMFYVNQVGGQTEVIFDGGSVVMDAGGELIREMPYFEESLDFFDLEDLKKSKTAPKKKEKIQLIHDAIVVGIRDYFYKLGFKKAILGLSGGVDSALTLALAVEALGNENVLSVLMPSQYSSDHSVNDSVALCENLNSPYKTIPIKTVYDSLYGELEEHFENKPADVTEENLQARIRGNMLMALSNKFGYILLNTTNKSEAAVGYGTLYGDLCGGLSVLGDVYKMEVYAVCEYINRDKEIIPNHILTKPPSAELRPDQKDIDSLPPYEILDQILFNYIELRKGPREILAMGFEENVIKRSLMLVNRSEYKRYQTAPMLRVSSKAFGMGRRMPIVAKYLS